MTMAVWWSFHAWFNVCRKLLFKEFRTSSLTWWGGEAEETRQHVIVAGKETRHRDIIHPSITTPPQTSGGCLWQLLTLSVKVKGHVKGQLRQ